MGEFISGPNPSASASTGLAQYRFVSLSGGTLGYPANGAPIDGVTAFGGTTASTVNQALAIQIGGVALVEAAGSTLAAGQLVAASSVGRVVAWTTGKICVGRLWDGASSGTTGRIVPVLLQSFAHSTAI